MNSMTAIGNLVRDPEIRSTKTGKTVAQFTVATNDSYTTGDGEVKERTSYIPVVAWGKMAEGLQGVSKGANVCAEGRYTSRLYETPDGTKRYVTEVTANFVGISVIDINKQQGQHDFGRFGKSTSEAEEPIPF